MPPPDTAGSFPPRVLLIMPEQWPRALLRAALRELGYDAVGAPSLAAALHFPVDAPERGAVRLVLLDQATLADEEAASQLELLLRRHREPAPMLLSRAMPATALPPAAATVAWRRVLHRPVSVGDLVAAIQAVAPLPPGSQRPLD
jgi:DNA-binding response OmpR family regulator